MTDSLPTTATMTPDERRLWHRCDGIASLGSTAERLCLVLVERGLAYRYDSHFGNDYYKLTEVGEKAFYGE